MTGETMPEPIPLGRAPAVDLENLKAALRFLLGAYRDERLAVFECATDEYGAVHEEADRLRLALMDQLIANGEAALASADPFACAGTLGQLLGAYREERAFVFACVADGADAVREPEDRRLLDKMDAIIRFAIDALAPPAEPAPKQPAPSPAPATPAPKEPA